MSGWCWGSQGHGNTRGRGLEGHRQAPSEPPLLREPGVGGHDLHTAVRFAAVLSDMLGIRETEREREITDKERERERETEKYRQRETDRATDKRLITDRERDRDRQTERERRKERQTEEGNDRDIETGLETEERIDYSTL